MPINCNSKIIPYGPIISTQVPVAQVPHAQITHSNATNNNVFLGTQNGKNIHKAFDVNSVIATDCITALSELTTSSSGTSMEDDDDENFDSVSVRMNKRRKQKQPNRHKYKHKRHRTKHKHHKIRISNGKSFSYWWRSWLCYSRAGSRTCFSMFK